MSVCQCVIVQSVQENMEHGGKCEVLGKQFFFDIFDTSKVELSVRNRIIVVI